MSQCYSNARDPLKGRQLPVLYSAREASLLLAVRQSRQPVSAGGRLGDGLGLQARPPHRRGLDRRRRDGRGRFPPRPDLRRGLPRPGRSSTSSTTSGRSRPSRASRAARRRPSPRARSAIGLAGLRVDGNDFLAVYAATNWAAERARANHGATLIELFTYRAGPIRRATIPAATAREDEAEDWPLGDPIERLKRASDRASGEWSEERQAQLADSPTSCERRGRRRRGTRGRERSTTLERSAAPATPAPIDDVRATCSRTTAAGTLRTRSAEQCELGELSRWRR